MQAYQFPTLTKEQQHQSVQQRIEAAEQAAWQKGYDEGLKQGQAALQADIEKRVSQQAELLLQERELELKQQMLAQFDVLTQQTKQQLNLLSNEVLKIRLNKSRGASDVFIVLSAQYGVANLVSQVPKE